MACASQGYANELARTMDCLREMLETDLLAGLVMATQGWFVWLWTDADFNRPGDLI